MVRTNRRQFGSLALLGAGHLLLCGRSALGYPAPQQKKLNSTLAGVLVGCHSYSFRDRDLEEALMMMAEVGFGAVELWQDHMEFTHGGREGEAREQLRQWRLSVPLSEFEVAAALASERRTEFYAYNFAFWDDVTDAEIDRVFEMTKALGAKVVTGAANPAMVPRIDAHAKKHQMRVGIENGSQGGESSVVTAADIEAVRSGASDYIAIALDIGDLTAANGDPVSFIERHHGDIVSLHVKDRKKDQGPAVPFGEGDTPIREVLTLLREKKYPIPANIRYEYEGADSFRQVRTCYRYCARVLG